MNYCKLARQSLTHWLTHQRTLSVPERAGMAAACFVSLHTKAGELRGCIGTIEPVQSDLNEEIIANAVSAGTRDSRFPSVGIDELDDLVFEVSVLHPPEAIEGEHHLDPKHYGVIVQNGGRRGVLLPDLDGVDTVAYQVSIARRKAYIGEDEPIELWRFRVEKHHE